MGRIESLEATLREEYEMKNLAFLRTLQVGLQNVLTECFKGAVSQIRQRSGVSLGDNETGPEGISGGEAGASALGAVNLGAIDLGVPNNSTVPPANLGPQPGQSYGYERITNLVNDRNRNRNIDGTWRDSANVSSGRNRPGNLDLFVVNQSADNVQIVKNWVVNRVEWENSEFHLRTVLVPEASKTVLTDKKVKIPKGHNVDVQTLILEATHKELQTECNQSLYICGLKTVKYWDLDLQIMGLKDFDAGFTHFFIWIAEGNITVAFCLKGQMKRLNSFWHSGKIKLKLHESFLRYCYLIILIKSIFD